MTKFHSFLAQAQQPAPGGVQALVQFAPLVLMFAAMYFLLIAPQRKKQKEHEKMMASLKTGDEVITTGGVYGTITGVKDDRYIIRVGENNQKLEISKSFIHALVKKTDAA